MNMNNFKEKMYRFMYGRYGTDQLYTFCSVLSLVVVVANLVVSVAVKNPTARMITSGILLGLFVALFAWNTFRSMSKKIYKRRRENGIFLNIVGVLRRIVTFNTSSKTKSGNKDDNYYIFRDCTKCSCTLRLPKKKGRNKVKCPKCSHKFYVISK